MKGPLLTGPARDALIAYLQANINAVIQSPDIVRTDGIALDPINPNNYFIDARFTPLTWPAIFVIMGKFTFNYARGQNYIDGTHDLETVIVVQETTYDRILQKTESYARVLFNVLDQKSIADAANRFQLKMVSHEIEYSDTFETKTAPGSKYYRRAVIYKWKAMHFEKTLIP